MTSEFTHVNVVIRLSKAKQSVFRSCTFCNVPLLLLSMRTSGKLTPVEEMSLRNTRNFLLSLMLKLCNMTRDTEGNRHVLFLQVWSFWYLVRSNILCIHLNLNSRLMPMWCDRLPSIRGSNARLFRFELNTISLFCCFTLLHQPVPNLVPNYPPAPLCNVSWGLSVCSVLVWSVSPCRLVLEVRLFPSPPALFCPLARRWCPLFSSSCLSGFTRLRPGVCVSVCNI